MWLTWLSWKDETVINEFWVDPTDDDYAGFVAQTAKIDLEAAKRIVKAFSYVKDECCQDPYADDFEYYMKGIYEKIAFGG